MSESMVIAGMTPESGTYANGEKARVKDIINKWETHYDPKLYARIGAFVMDGADIDDILRALQPLDRALSEPKRQRYTRIFNNWLEIDNKAKELYELPMTEEYLWKVINEELKQNEGIAKFFGQWRLAYGKSIKENLATWLMQGKKKEEVEELLKDRRFIPQEYVNNRDLNKFVEMSNDPERYISDQLVEWLETSLPIEAVAAKLKTSLRSVNYATKFYFEYMIFFQAKLDHTKALHTIKALVNMLLHAYR